MAKLITTDLSNLNNPSTVVSTINANNAKIETAMENTLSRDGTSPNSMGASLDMNSNKILNLPAPSSNTEPVRLADVSTLISDQVGTPAVTDRVVATRDSLADLSTTDNHVAYLREAGREGIFVFDSSNLSTEVSDDTEQGAYVAPSTDTTGAHGAWVKKFNRPPRPEDFGGKDFAAADGCRRYAQRETGEMEFGPYTYELNDDLIFDSDIYVRGMKGKTVLDFSSRSGFTKGSDDGFIQFRGSAGTAKTIAKSIKRRKRTLPRIISGTRSGTTITYGTDIPHELQTGTPVWIFGGSSSTEEGQRVFYTQNLDSNGSSATRTTPYIVKTTADDYTFTVTCEDTGDTTLTGTFIFVQFASDVTILSSVTGINPGDVFKFTSDAVRTDGASENITIGEFQTVQRTIPSINAVVFHSEVRDSYFTSENAKIIPVSLIRPSLRDVAIYGHGANTGAGSGYGDRGAYFVYCRDAVAEGLYIKDVDQMGISFTDVKGGRQVGNSIYFDGTDEDGRTDDELDIQYGIAVNNACEGILTQGNIIEGGRHSILQSVAGPSSARGVVRDWTIDGNTLKGAWLSCIASHQSVSRITITNNKISGSQSGINIRYCDDSVISGNVIETFQFGIDLYNHVGQINISNNQIRAGMYGIWAHRPINTANFTGPIRIINNDINGGENGVYVVDTIGSFGRVDVDHNTIRGFKDIAIRIDYDGGFYGSISNNQIFDAEDVSDEARYYAIYVTNPHNVVICNNIIDSGASAPFVHYVYSDGSAATGCVVNNNIGPVAPTTSRVNLTTGINHVVDGGSAVSVTISNGAITVPTGVTCVSVDTEGQASSDNLDTINGMTPGQFLALKIVTQTRAITVRDAFTSGGNIQTISNSSVSLADTRDILLLVHNGSEICQIALGNG